MAAGSESRFPALFNKAGRWVKDHRSGSFAALTFAVSVSLALFFGLSSLSEPNPKLTYEILRETHVLGVRTPVEDMQITFQNEDIQGKTLTCASTPCASLITVKSIFFKLSTTRTK